LGRANFQLSVVIFPDHGDCGKETWWEQEGAKVACGAKRGSRALP